MASFNHQQRMAVEHVDHPCLVLAGPGSGKTTVITHRTKKLIEEEGISLSNILVITFTKAAAMEMPAEISTAYGWETSAGFLWDISCRLFSDFKICVQLQDGKYYPRGKEIRDTEKYRA